MINWAEDWKAINSRDELPKDRQFLIMFKCAIHLAEYDSETDLFSIVSLPTHMLFGLSQKKEKGNLLFGEICHITLNGKILIERAELIRKLLSVGYILSPTAFLKKYI